MTRQIYNSSPMMKKHKGLKYDWPWRDLECGQSFDVPKTELKFTTLRAMASQKGSELQRKFRVLEHNDHYEIGRIK